MSLKPGWLVSVGSVSVSASVWLPWSSGLASGVHHLDFGPDFLLPSQIGLGQSVVLLSSITFVLGAMVGQGIYPHRSAMLTLIFSSMNLSLIVWSYVLLQRLHRHIVYGFYCAGACGIVTVICSLWAVGVAMACSYQHRHIRS